MLCDNRQTSTSLKVRLGVVPYWPCRLEQTCTHMGAHRVRQGQIMQPPNQTDNTPWMESLDQKLPRMSPLEWQSCLKAPGHLCLAWQQRHFQHALEDLQAFTFRGNSWYLSLVLETTKIELRGVHMPRSPSALSVETRMKWLDHCLGDTYRPAGRVITLSRSCSLAHTHTPMGPRAHLVIAGGVCLFEIA